jgi:hypothetical protein
MPRPRRNDDVAKGETFEKRAATRREAMIIAEQVARHAITTVFPQAATARAGEENDGETF